MAAGRPASATRKRERPRRRPAPLKTYFDTSALIKLLIEEPDSGLAAELWSRSSSRIASRLVYPEARAALAAAHRADRLDHSAHDTAVTELAAACSAMHLIGVDWDLATTAGELAQTFALRGYDAVHLATALAAGDLDLAFVTWDQGLARAAARAGLPTTPPPQGG